MNSICYVFPNPTHRHNGYDSRVLVLNLGYGFSGSLVHLLQVAAVATPGALADGVSWHSNDGNKKIIVSNC